MPRMLIWAYLAAVLGYRWLLVHLTLGAHSQQTVIALWLQLLVFFVGALLDKKKGFRTALTPGVAKLCFFVLVLEWAANFVLRYLSLMRLPGFSLVIVSSSALLSTMLLSTIMMKRRYSPLAWIAGSIVVGGVCASLPVVGAVDIGSSLLGVVAFAIPGLGMIGKEILMKSEGDFGGVKGKPLGVWFVAFLATVAQLLVFGRWDVHAPAGFHDVMGLTLIGGILRLTLHLALQYGSSSLVQFANALAIPLGALLLAPSHSEQVTIGLAICGAGLALETLSPGNGAIGERAAEKQLSEPVGQETQVPVEEVAAFEDAAPEAAEVKAKEPEPELAKDEAKAPAVVPPISGPVAAVDSAKEKTAEGKAVKEPEPVPAPPAPAAVAEKEEVTTEPKEEAPKEPSTVKKEKVVLEEVSAGEEEVTPEEEQALLAKAEEELEKVEELPKEEDKPAEQPDPAPEPPAPAPEPKVEAPERNRAKAERTGPNYNTGGYMADSRIRLANGAIQQAKREAQDAILAVARARKIVGGKAEKSKLRAEKTSSLRAARQAVQAVKAAFEAVNEANYWLEEVYKTDVAGIMWARQLEREKAEMRGRLQQAREAAQECNKIASVAYKVAKELEV